MPTFLWVLGRQADGDVELGGELARFGALNRAERDHYGLTLAIIANAAQNSVAFIHFVPFDVTLSREEALVSLTDGHVNMRSPARIGNRFDGAEVVAAFQIGHEPAIALEVAIFLTRFPVCSTGVDVVAKAIHLPDLDQSILDRLPVDVPHGAGEMRDLADCRGDAVIDDEQVVVRIQRILVWIIRAFCLARRLGQRFRKGAWHGEESSRTDQGTPQKLASMTLGAVGKEGRLGLWGHRVNEPLAD